MTSQNAYGSTVIQQDRYTGTTSRDLGFQDLGGFQRDIHAAHFYSEMMSCERKTPFKNPFSRWCKNLWVGAELPKSKHKNGFSAKNKKTLQPVRTDNSLRIKSYEHE